MKTHYESPEAQVVNLAALAQIAVIDEHSDLIDGDLSFVQGGIDD